MITARVTSPFGFESTATEVIAGIDLHDRQALVTGPRSLMRRVTSRTSGGIAQIAPAGIHVTTAGGMLW